VKLGFMSFFVKASCLALQRFPEINAEIDGKNIVYHHYCDVGVAVSTEKGLMVPPLRNAESMSFAEIEKTIEDLARRGREGKLKPEELQGGTFTITNGGVFGLHAIQERPVVRSGQIVIRSMMYVALTYDHRIVDGKGAVSFLKTIKELVEEPSRLLLDI
jgi:2-oxoglutarate dehydrogenase E2 component (dihydrolipoamide succinyltransferase)